MNNFIFLNLAAALLSIGNAQAHTCENGDICYVTDETQGTDIAENTVQWHIIVSTDSRSNVTSFAYTGRDSNSEKNGWSVVGSPLYKEMRANRAVAVKKAIAAANALKAGGVCGAVVDNSDAN